jgi:hypothetical protein
MIADSGNTLESEGEEGEELASFSHTKMGVLERDVTVTHSQTSLRKRDLSSLQRSKRSDPHWFLPFIFL